MKSLVMNNQQLAQLQKLLNKERRNKRKKTSRFPFPAADTAAELRERYGSVDLALEFVPLGIGAWQYRYRQGYWPEQDRWMLDYLLTNDLKKLTGLEIPNEYRDKAIRMSQRSSQ